MIRFGAPYVLCNHVHPNLTTCKFKQFCIHSKKNFFLCLISVSLKFLREHSSFSSYNLSLIIKNTHKKGQQTSILMAQIPTNIDNLNIELMVVLNTTGRQKNLQLYQDQCKLQLTAIRQASVIYSHLLIPSTSSPLLKPAPQVLSF